MPLTPKYEEDYKYRPRRGYHKHVYNSKSEREKSYVNPIDFSLLIRENRHMTEEQKLHRLEVLLECYALMKACGIVQSKTQFAAAMLQMYRTPIPIADAAAIIQTSRQWLYNLETAGRIHLLRSTHRKVFILPEDLIKIMEARL